MRLYHLTQRATRHFHRRHSQPDVLCFIHTAAVSGGSFFTLVVHFSAKVMRGNGSVSRTTTSMFYAAAFLPIVLLVNYLQSIDPVAVAIAIPVVIYVVTKLVSAAKFIFSVGTIRALIAVGAGGIAYLVYE